MNKLFLLVIFAYCSFHLSGNPDRRLGKRHDISWNDYFSLGSNGTGFDDPQLYPDLSVVGALISNWGSLGTATLIAPNYIVTAAHVLKNDYYEQPVASDWKFVLNQDISLATTGSIYQIEKIVIHPAWIARQTLTNKLGDGDELGVDLALAKLTRSVTGQFPARLPDYSDDPLGERCILAGYGTLVEGSNGVSNNSNDQRAAGENIVDRSVAKVSKTGVPDDQLGGLLGIDFDSSQSVHNNLRNGVSIDLLGNGDSLATPLALEASTAVGDSGGPAFVRTKGSWRIHGVVSYGTTDSSYGDVTIYTRLASHYDWIMSQLPNWPDSKLIDGSEWLQNPWLGFFLPIQSGWNFHLQMGWIYASSSGGNSFWAWSDLIKKWIWLSDQAFPFIYCYNPTDPFWIYVLLESSSGGSIRAYNYSSDRWESFSGN